MPAKSSCSSNPRPIFQSRLSISSPMNTALIDHYRCPDEFANLELKGHLPRKSGYFRFGQDTICYGKSTSGFCATRGDAVLYDVLNDVTIDGSHVLLPFDPVDVVDNLRLE